MAQKMDVMEIISFEEMLLEEDLQSVMGSVGCSRDTYGFVSDGEHSLINDSYLFLVNGNIYKNKTGE